MKRVIHIVWAKETGPVAAYTDPTMAYTHARTMLGVDVSTCEIREQVPDVVRDDLEVEWDSDDETPRVVDVELDAIPDAVIHDGKKRRGDSES